MKPFGIILVLLTGCLCIQNNATRSQKEALIMFEEADSQDAKPESRQSFDGSDVCDPQYTCMPISSCPLLEDLLDKSCLGSDKLTALTCGWKEGEARVCCPPGSGPSLPSQFNSRPPGIQADSGSTSAAGASQQAVSETCGRPVVQARNYDGIGAHPWVVRIGFRNRLTGQMRHPCTGSIISKRVVLTAAHCALAKADDYKLSSVSVGEYNTETDPDCGEMFCAAPVQVIPISHVIVHPGYDRKVYRHDIALVVLRQDIKFTVASLPLCLSGVQVPTTGSVKGDIVGWGRLGGQRSTPSIRQRLTVPIQPLEECSKIYAQAAPLAQSQLCAGGEQGGDACAGFGGAPLIVLVDGRYTQVGIVSFGSEKCGSAGVPSVYTNVFSYSNWIRDNSPPS